MADDSLFGAPVTPSKKVDAAPRPKKKKKKSTPKPVPMEPSADLFDGVDDILESPEPEVKPKAKATPKSANVTLTSSAAPKRHRRKLDRLSMLSPNRLRHAATAQRVFNMGPDQAKAASAIVSHVVHSVARIAGVFTEYRGRVTVTREDVQRAWNRYTQQNVY